MHGVLVCMHSVLVCTLRRILLPCLASAHAPLGRRMASTAGGAFVGAGLFNQIFDSAFVHSPAGRSSSTLSSYTLASGCWPLSRRSPWWGYPAPRMGLGHGQPRPTDQCFFLSKLTRFLRHARRRGYHLLFGPQGFLLTGAYTRTVWLCRLCGHALCMCTYL